MANGNVITYFDVVENRKITGADGIMSAEGILDDPALFLSRWGGEDDDGDDGTKIEVRVPSPLATVTGAGDAGNGGGYDAKAKRKLQKKLRDILKIESKLKQQGGEGINDEQRTKLAAKPNILSALRAIIGTAQDPCHPSDDSPTTNSKTKKVPLRHLRETANDKIALATEYLSLVRRYPMKIRSVVFHVRRMCKNILEQLQLMEECIASTSIEEVEAFLVRCKKYVKHPESFRYDRDKAARDKEALDRKKLEVVKRKTYEGRMVRKAKREGLEDLEFYLRIGAEVPTTKVVERLKAAPREERMEVWKKDHSQHCMGFHLEVGGCKRDRACAFLHVDAKGANTFVETDEVAG